MPTIYEQFLASVKAYGDNEALAELTRRAYRPITYGELHEKVLKLASALSPHIQKGEKVAVMLDNGAEWATVDLACACLGAVVVPIHTTYNFQYVQRIIEHSDSVALFIGTKYYKKFEPDFGAVKVRKIYLVGDGDGIADGRCVFLREFLGADRDQKPPAHGVSENDIHTIVYTSGTTGSPKGVMLSHRNLVSNALEARKHIAVYPTDRFFSFLPLSHILERTAGFYIPLFSGASIYYARGKDTIGEDIKQARPTILVSVPRIFEKVHDKVMDTVRSSSHLKQKLFYNALDLSRKKRHGGMSAGERFACAILDRVALRKVRAALGGRLRFSVSGGASLSKRIAKFFETLGILVIEGYGLTETSPIITENRLDRYKFGTVGLPLDTVQLKIAPDKEILASGESVMHGYYKDEAATREAVDTQRWFHTGDLGFIDEDGFLVVIGRKKEMIVLSTGKNVAPVPIEQALEENKYIMQAMVYGNNQKYLSAFIVPDFDELQLWCSANGIEYRLPEALKNEKVIALYRGEIDHALAHFPPVDQIKEFKLLPKEFTQEEDLLTPTLKLKRGRILSVYS